MRTIPFHKYQATGNDFIMVDNREGIFPKENLSLVKHLCHRKFGIGSDGLILLEEHTDVDFNMVFYNPDGSQSLCGNGSRCAVNFAKAIGLITDQTTFMACDGLHSATVKNTLVNLSMKNVQNIRQVEDGIFMNTGAPHVIKFVADVRQIDIVREGSLTRYSDQYKPMGTNVNFVQQLGGNQIWVRTYERGVENETLSCGTGVTAAAIAANTMHLKAPIEVVTKGGKLSVNYEVMEDGSFSNIYLTGVALLVYEGQVEICI